MALSQHAAVEHKMRGADYGETQVTHDERKDLPCSESPADVDHKFIPLVLPAHTSKVFLSHPLVTQNTTQTPRLQTASCVAAPLIVCVLAYCETRSKDQPRNRRTSSMFPRISWCSRKPASRPKDACLLALKSQFETSIDQSHPQHPHTLFPLTASHVASD